MKKKEASPEEKIKQLSEYIEDQIRRWKYIKEHGCNDPSWCDGSNMNLLRNHILYSKKQISDMCIENEIELPYIMQVPTPPEVSNTYMADLKCNRAKKLKLFHRKMIHCKVEYDETQLSLFWNGGD